MSDLREILDQHLRRGNMDALELVDIVPVPMHGDRMVRLRTLEEALEDFSGENGAASYLIQVKARGPAAPAAIEPATIDDTIPTAPHRPSAATASPVTGDNIYQGDGKLNIPYLSRNAELLLAAQDYPMARNIYKAIAASGERTGLALFGIGRCDEAEGRLDDARAHYEESIAYHPTLESYHRLSSVLMHQKKEEVAAETLERALNLKDLDTRTRFELHKSCGNCWTRTRQAEQAEGHYKQALEIDPAADDIRANLAALYLQSQNLSEAKRHFEDALASNPRNERALAGLASCHLALGDKRRAHDTFARSLEIELNNPTAIFHLVKCAYDIRSYATAARVVEEYVQIAPVNVNLLYSLAGLQFHLGRMKDARATATQILSLNAEHAGAQELLKLIERSET